MDSPGRLPLYAGKMMFTAEELEILNNTHFLTVKNQINKKVVGLLSEIEQGIKKIIDESTFDFPEGTITRTGKISKGEQYEGLPYYVLDYPRKFTSKDVFAYRVMLVGT